jgi:hypothetical protein
VVVAAVVAGGGDDVAGGGAYDGRSLAGSFSCPSLVDTTPPGKSVAVSGSFAVVMKPPD